MLNFRPATEFVAGLCASRVESYCNYWHELRPRSEEDRLRRWVFAVSSVHTTWKANVTLYRELKDLSWIQNPLDIENRIKRSGAGLHTMRARSLQDLVVHRGDLEVNRSSWATRRDELSNKIFGLGFAKTSFALEMIYPLEADVLCADTHVLQLYGHNPNHSHTTADVMTECEHHWVTSCRSRGFPPAIVRHIFWDIKQNKSDCSYWADELAA